MNDNTYIPFNINNYVKVKLTNKGKSILAECWGGHILDWYKDYTDKNGYIQFQLHELMNIFGKYCINGVDISFENNTILINTNNKYLSK